jgi:hypothetical protein
MAREGYAGYLIRKGNYYYRPRWSGYTKTTLDAGRYTLEQAQAEQRTEPDNFTIHPAPETLPNGITNELVRLLHRETERL